MTDGNGTARREDESHRSLGDLGLRVLAKRSAVMGAAGLAPLVLLVGVVYAIDVLLLAFAGILFAVLLRSLSELLQRFTRLNDNWSLAGAVLSILVLATATVWLLVPSIAEQTAQLQKTLPKSVETLKSDVAGYEWGRWLLHSAPQANEMMPKRQELFG